MAKLTLLLALVGLLSALTPLCNALPVLWYAPATLKARCGKHPAQAFKVHGAPMIDSGVKWSVKAAKAKVEAKSLCPGQTYTVKVSWKGAHHALLTSSVGSWGKDGWPKCTGSSLITSLAGASSMTRTLRVPCNAKGKASLKVTHSAPGIRYMQSSKTLSVSAACAAAACKKSG